MSKDIINSDEGQDFSDLFRIMIFNNSLLINL